MLCYTYRHASHLGTSRGVAYHKAKDNHIKLSVLLIPISSVVLRYQVIRVLPPTTAFDIGSIPRWFSDAIAFANQRLPSLGSWTALLMDHSTFPHFISANLAASTVTPRP